MADIFRMMKEYVAGNQTAQIQRLLRVLGQEFAMSQNPNSRKGGLIGLAACAISLSRVSSLCEEGYVTLHTIHNPFLVNVMCFIK